MRLGGAVFSKEDYAETAELLKTVMPAWIAGIQVRRMRPETFHVNLGSSTPRRNDKSEAGLPGRTVISAAFRGNAVLLAGYGCTVSKNQSVGISLPRT
ncbi:MAG: hypothetical protein ACREQV_23740, partial [Candidatus Binatia bacterium]